MSRGERSCSRYAVDCPKINGAVCTCNVDCRFYQWDRKTKPDTESTKKLNLPSRKSVWDLAMEFGRVKKPV